MTVTTKAVAAANAAIGDPKAARAVVAELAAELRPDVRRELLVAANNRHLHNLVHDCLRNGGSAGDVLNLVFTAIKETP